MPKYEPSEYDKAISKFNADQFWLIPNLIFLNRIGYKLSEQAIKAHNSVASEYELTKIDPITQQYVKKGDEKYADL